ncbi:MAG: 1-deoxy-D-xylulose-5-phosphate synthase [Clostridiales bacterium]|nr:1-deoxy-D-xylulose-5-phosphate synthase [Clostridiales bacterium]
MVKLLDSINEPSDIKKLNINQLNQLSIEVREFILDSVSKTGGHLSSNLGTIEMTIALHYVFDSPEDKLLWDVGHQAYTHKILTGRKDKFNTLRKLDGLSGFLKRSESIHDILEAGHSSTSISAALGLSRGNEYLQKSDYVIPIIGDGALTAGMAYEALNYAGQCKSQLIIVLNDNEMSISNNVGSISKYLNRIRGNKIYTLAKRKSINYLTKSKFGTKTYRLLSKAKSGIKELIIPGMLFEHFGLSYLGPVDGHNIKELIETLQLAKKIEKPILFHVKTVKGKGYEFAEKNPDLYHGVGVFDLMTGVKPSETITYSKVFGDQLLEMAKKDQKIVAITAAMSSGTGLTDFSNMMKNRFIDVGIAEQNAVTMACGLALSGYKPYVAIYSTFLQRAYDQIIHDIALQNLNVVFCIDRSGLVGSDGETHQGIFDTSYLNLIPNMTIMVHKDRHEFIRIMNYSSQHEGPMAIKYFRDSAIDINEDDTSLFDPELIIEGRKTLVITAGRLVNEAITASRSKNMEVGILNIRTIKPMNYEKIYEIVKNYERIIILEENIYTGSFAIQLENFLLKKKISQIEICTLPDQFIEQGEIYELLARYNLDANGILSIINKGL